MLRLSVGRGMELRQLRYFVAVAEALSFRRAAERLHMTQPPISQQIRQLEELLGVSLLVRDRQHVELTDSGRLLLHKAKAILAEVADLHESLSRANRGQTGIARLGVEMGLAKTVEGVITEYTRRFPKVSIQYRDIFSQKPLRTREIDVAILRPPLDNARFMSERLFEERFVVILPRKSGFAQRKSLRLEDVADQVLVLPTWYHLRHRVLRMYRDIGVTPKVVETSALPQESGAMLASSGKGIYVLPGTPVSHSYYFGREVVAVPLEGSPPVEVRVAWRKGETSPAALNLVNTAREVFQQSLQGGRARVSS